MSLKLLAWDYSASTDNVAHYFDVGKSYITKFVESFQSDKKVKFVTWDRNCIEVKVNELHDICTGKKGTGPSTAPSCLVKWILENVREEEIELWLITDGEIHPSDLSICAELNRKVKYTTIKFIIISKSNISLSVGAAFFSGSNVEIYRNLELIKHVDTSKPFDYEHINLANYDEQIVILSDYIQGNYMGHASRGLQNAKDLQEIDRLTNLRKRLLNELHNNDNSVNKDGVDNLIFTSKYTNDIIEKFKQLDFYKTLTSPTLVNKRSEIDGTISSIINYINSSNRTFEFQDFRNVLQNVKIDTVEEEVLENESLESIEKVEFYDPISLEVENTTPMLFLNVCDFIKKYWEDGNYASFRRIVDCPFMADLSGSIGHIFSFETFQSLRSHNQMINPMTNQSSYGGLLFGNNLEIHKWNDYILASTFFRGKKVSPDFGIWYYMIWKEAETKEWISPEIMVALKKYAFMRLECCKVRIGFSSLPLDPKERVPVPIACFYCTEGSSKLFGEHYSLFLHERLRMFHSVAGEMLDVLQNFGYNDVDKDFVLSRAKTFKLVNKLKKIPQPLAKQYLIMEHIFEKVDKRFLVSTLRSEADETRLEPNVLNILKYDHRSKIPFDWKTQSFESAIKNMEFGYIYTKKYDVKICPQTFRPFFVVEDISSRTKVSNYVQILDSVRDVSMTDDGVVNVREMPDRVLKQSKLMSLCKMYIGLTSTLKRFPTLREFKNYVAKGKGLIEGKRIFLFPSNILEDIVTVFEMYKDAIMEYKVGVDEFIQKAQGTTNRKERIQKENSLGEDFFECLKFVEDAEQLLVKKK